MNNISKNKHLRIICFAGCAIFLLTSNLVLAQVTNTDISAFGFNGKIAIKTTNATTLSSYFVLNNGTVDLDFYFNEDDLRNGIYSGTPLPQPNGQIYIYFSGLQYQIEDTLSFIATEILTSGTTKHYVFVRGDYFPESVGPLNTCPTSFTCNPAGKGIKFIFDPKEIILGFSSMTPITIEIPSAGIDQIRYTWGIAPDENAISIKFIGMNCENVMLGPVTISYNGLSCYFVNGQLTCPPWGNVPEDLSGTCAPYFEDCALELINLITENQFTLPCLQWVNYSTCSTTSLIHREGAVSIGTATAAPNFALTVKNGIITDRLKVTNTGWADYVFEKDYDLMPLEEVAAYIAKYHHLPGTPSGKEVETNGSFELGETTINHQVKIEEIFLHLIQLEEETKVLEAQLFLYETLNKMRLKKQ